MKILAPTQTDIAQISEDYIKGDWDGSTGGQPIPELWLNSPDYRQGYQKGQAEFFNRKFSKEAIA